MPFYTTKHHRHSIRLKDYDYSQPGSYFVTICTHNHKKLFGDIDHFVGAGSEPAPTNRPLIHSLESNQTEHEKMNLNSFGEILLFTWNDLINHYKGIKLGDFVIMPNHFHGIIHIVDLDTEWDDFIPSNFKYHDVVAGLEPAPTDHAPLSEIVRQLKTFSARRINRERKTPGISVWQRNYYEHIIRTKESYDQIVEYIQNNPMMWKMDKLFVV